MAASHGFPGPRAPRASIAGLYCNTPLTADWRNRGRARSHRRASGPGEHPQRILQHGADVAQHGGAEIPVDDPVVEGKRERRDLADGELALVHPWSLPDLAERKDRRLAGGKD